MLIMLIDESLNPFSLKPKNNEEWGEDSQIRLIGSNWTKIELAPLKDK